MVTEIATAILVINEMMASNLGEAMSPATNFDSWIEVYNPGDKAIDMGGMYLSKSDANLKYWKMPNDIGSVPAKGYKVIWLGSNDIKATQATFKLDCDGGKLYLSDKNGNVIDSQEYPKAISHTSWARKTDGGSEWGWTANVTPEASNTTSVFANERLAAPVVSLGSTLFKNSVNVKVTIPEGTRLMYTTDGSLPSAPKGDQEEVSPWTNFIVNGDCEGDDATCLISRDADGSGDVERIVNGVGVDGSRGIKIHSTANAKNDWDAQFFVYTPGHVWQSGEKYKFYAMVRADKKARVTTQTHGAPHDYITGSVMDGSYNVTTSWTPISFEGTITDQQTGSSYDWWSGQSTAGRMQSIVFNLNVDKKDNNFYFDNVSWELYTADDTAVEATQESKDGKFTVSNTTNFTFRLFRDGYLPSVPVTRSYIKTSNNYTLPVVSIVGDKSYFTDPKIGFDCDGDGTNGKTGNGQDNPKNYNQDWDRPVNFSYISPEGEMLHNQDVNISASGGFTRSQRYRSFKLKTNKVFDGQNQFDYAFFPQKPYIRSKVLLIRNGGNDIWEHNARFMDPALETIIQRSGIDVDVQSYVPVIEYVNGQLRGVFNMREPNNDKFAYANWGYDDDELDAFENQELKNGDDVVMKRIFELGEQATDPAAYEELKTLLDIDEFTNYVALTLFLYNDDWPDNNIKCYRSRDNGRFRYVSFDLDYAFKGCWDASVDNPFTNFAKFKDDNTAPRVSKNKEFVNLFLNLLKNDDYRRRFIDTFCLMGGSVFEPTRANAIVDELLEKVKAMCQLMKQQGINDGHDPDRCASDIKTQLKGRSDKMTNFMKQFADMKLSSATRQAVTLKSGTDGARLFVNGLEVPYSDFNGHLFAPVTLRAEAPAGYRFAGWKQGSSIVSREAEMSLPSGSTVSLTATFTKLEDSELAEEGIHPVCINEVSAGNGIFVNDLFKRNDWIELYNTTDKPIDIEGMYLSDNAKKPLKYQITSKQDSGDEADYQPTIIPAHGYLIVWCDKLEPTSQLHASFKLDDDGGEVLLTAADESWTETISYGPMKGDESIGRYPDGTGSWFTMNVPTIEKANVVSSYSTPIIQSNINGIADLAVVESTLTVQYAQRQLVVNGSNDGEHTVSIVSMAGQQLSSMTVQLANGMTYIPVSTLPSGAYVAVVTDANGQKATCKFVKSNR